MGTTISDSAIMSYMWPDVNMTEIGLFGENTYNLSDQNRLKFGLRYDLVHVTAGKVDNATTHGMSGNRTANDLYLEDYGYGWENKTEHNVSGLMRYEYDLAAGLNVYGTLSRSVRTADATERGVAKNTSAGQAATRWYGNPNIKPEKHHQLELGTSYVQKGWSLGGSTYYNKVSDYILRDNATGQDGILLSNNADIYRNVDATLMGLEVSGGIDLTDELSFKANAAYTHGENDEDNRPLAQIAPLEVGATVEYATADWMAALSMRAAAKQNRADVGTVTSGQDTEKTGGYAVFDLTGKIYSYDPVEISLGVSNILDKTYSNHLNRSSSFDNEVTKVNEPGRSFFVRLNASF
jgi:iron complex outermembrane receptor protein